MIELHYTDEFARWLRKLRDQNAAGRITERVRRLARGNAGDVKAVSGPVMEIRIDYGPGYRVYFIRRGKTAVILLCGGDKRSQQTDIRRAREMADHWKE